MIALLVAALLAGGGGRDRIYNVGGVGSGGAGVSAADGVTKTTAAMTLYVDPTGNDANACTASGASACATIQGAINKVPKYVRHLVTINIAAGGYAGFFLTGFHFDFETPSAPAGIAINGTLANVTGLTTGTATGTLTSVSGVGASPGLDTVTDSAQNWTTNELRGRLFVATGGSGSGQVRPIYSNTATTLTLASGGSAIGFAAATTYAIQAPASVVTTGGNIPPMPTAGGTAGVGIWVGGNVSPRSNNGSSIQLTGIGVNLSTSPCLDVVGGGDTRVFNSTFVTSAATGVAVRATDAFGGQVYLDSVFAQVASTSVVGGVVQVGNASGIAQNNVSLAATVLYATGTTANGISVAGVGQAVVNSRRVVVDVSNNTSAFAAPVHIRDRGAVSGPVAQNAALWVTGNAARPCIWMPTAVSAGTPNFGGQTVFASARGLRVANCSTAIQTDHGNALIQLEQPLEINTATTGFDIRYGSRLSFVLSSGTVTFTSVTNQIQIDGTNYTYAGLEALSPPLLTHYVTAVDGGITGYGTTVRRAP